MPTTGSELDPDLTPASPPAPPAPPAGGAPETVARSQHDAVSCLLRLAASRAERAAAIESARAAALEDAETRLRASLREAETNHAEAVSRTDQEAEKAREAIEQRAEREGAEEDKAHKSSRGQATYELDAGQKAAEDGLRDAALMAEAAFEGGAGQPKREFDRVKGVVKQELATLDSIESHARRLAGPRVEFPNCHSEAETDESPVEPAEGGTPPLDRLIELRESANHRLRRMGGLTLHGVYRAGGPILAAFLAMVAGGAYGAFSANAGPGAATPDALTVIAQATVWGVVAAAAVLLVAAPLRMVALGGTRKRLGPLRDDLVAARAEAGRAVRLAEQSKTRIESEIAQRRESEIERSRSKYELRLRRVQQRRAQVLARIDNHHSARVDDIKKRRQHALAELEAKVAAKRAEVEAELARAKADAEQRFAADTADAEETRRAESDRLAAGWRDELERCGGVLAESHRLSESRTPAWDDASWAAWRPRPDPAPVVPIGAITLDLAEAPGGLPDEPVMDPGLGRSLPTRFDLPAPLDFPGRASLLVLAGEHDRRRALPVLQNAVLRLLTSLPPGKLRLTMIDPVGLGQTFAGFMRLADHDDRLVGGRIWTEQRHIEQRLADLTEHMETVIQKYLRNEHPTIEAYNEAAGEIAEPYRFLVVADFPNGFTDEAGRRLKSVIESGPRCGVYTVIHADPAAKTPDTVDLDTLRAASTVLLRGAGANPADNGDEIPHDGQPPARWLWDDDAYRDLPLVIENPPHDPTVTSLVDRVGEAAKDAGRVEVPFRLLSPPEGQLWSRSAAEEIRVPLGRAGATRHQELALGRGTSQHALIAGKTGSGKSTLLHVLITNAAQWYAPGEVEFYLVDFKKGVEFKSYAGDRLPHARAVAIESDREFGLSVLERLDEELKRRGDLFRDLGVQGLGAAREAARKQAEANGSPEPSLPRTLLIIDEFQEFFTEDDRIAQDAALLLDRLVRQGRAFGIHVLLGSQTLSGAYTLARSTMGQMAVRVALQCSETDSYIILSEDNAAARLLGRPGEAIYNDANGLVEGNSPFQIAWLPDAERARALDHLVDQTRQRAWRPPTPQIVFEGAVAADLAANHLLLAHASGELARPRAPEVWLGDPVAIKDPTAAVLRRQSGSNLLIVGQQNDTALALTQAALLGLAAQAHPGAKLFLIDATPPDDPAADTLRNTADALADAAGLAITAAGPRQAADVLAQFDAERDRRDAEDLADEPAWFCLIQGLQRIKALRKKDDDFAFSFSASDEDDGISGRAPAEMLTDLLRDGPALGLHAIAWVDTPANLSRALDRRSVDEFQLRAVMQMSATDSANLIESPAAGKLGPRRALLFNEEHGSLEKFRPYRPTPQDFVDRVASLLAAR